MDVTETIGDAIAASWLRDTSRIRSEQLRDIHRRLQATQYAVRTVRKIEEDVPSLLEELGPRRGMAWSDIATLVGVTVAAIRKWRQGGDAAPENRKRLAKIAALLDVIEESNLISDPAQWLEVPLPLPPGYTVRPMDLYKAGHVDALLDYAAHRIEPQALMDEVESDWRESRRSNFEVYDASDGQKAIRLRSRD